MANWLNPTITTQYDVFVAEAKERDVDAATMFLNQSSNPPIGSVRFNRTSKIFEEWNGTSWLPLVIGVTGGGTGANSGAGIGAALGLGTMAYQNSNSVVITGGFIDQITYLAPNCTIIPVVNNTYDIGTLNNRWRNGFYASGLVIPVGVDKFVVG